MSQATGYALRLNEARLSLLRDELTLTERFAEPVNDFVHSRQVPLVCFVVDRLGLTRYVAEGRRGSRAGTGLRRLNLSSIVALQEPIRLETFAELVPSRFRRALVRRVGEGGILTVRQFRALVDAIIARNEDLGSLLRRYSSARADRIEALTPLVRQQLAFQKEAVGTALSLAGLNRVALQAWDPPANGAPISFLQGLPQARLREDAMVVNDLAKLPGFTSIQTSIHGATVFEDETGVRLTVVLANRQPLEELTGADLIYVNETFRSFVMVQYKAMDSEGGGEPIYRLPNAQLDLEVTRMEGLIASIQDQGATQDVTGYRLSWQPFFLKLCPRVVFEPDNVSLSTGMYIPLGKWKLLAESPQLVGKRGGRGATFTNVRRYLDNTAFITLVANAWIGTTPAQSSLLAEAVRTTLESGRAAVIAVQSPSEDTAAPEAATLDLERSPE